MRYLTYSELIFINGKVLNDPDIMSGKQKIRDIDLLLAAEARPMASAFGQDAYPTLREKAIALLHAITRNHPFKDGNKRSATVAMIFMLEVNGQTVEWEREVALYKILDIAEGRSDLQTFDAWLQLLSCDNIAPDADLTRDTAHIDRIIATHRRLLDDLEQR
ncbi:MAG: type II toxin-antitoxin system death-on-curing family toxin [Aggregatilineales bacterium]